MHCIYKKIIIGFFKCLSQKNIHPQNQEFPTSVKLEYYYELLMFLFLLHSNCSFHNIYFFGFLLFETVEGLAVVKWHTIRANFGRFGFPESLPLCI